MARLAAKLALATVTLSVALVAAEKVLRASGYEYRPMSVAVGQEADARLFHLFRDEHFVYDAEMIWHPRPGFEIFNSQGFRGAELPAAKPEGARWIFALGDSNTLGWAGEDGTNWPELLAELLGRQDERLRVVNAGVWGYSSLQGLGRLREVLEYQPDLVLVSFGSNDAHDVARSDEEFIRSSRWGRELADFLGHYRLGQLLIATRDRLSSGSDSDQPQVRVPLEDYRDNLRRMAELTRAAGAEIVFLTRPFDGPIRSATWWKNRGYDYNLATAEVARELEAPLIDVYSFFKASPEQFSDESHFTDEGHRRAAVLIRDELQPLLRGRRPQRRERLRRAAEEATP